MLLWVHCASWGGFLPASCVTRSNSSPRLRCDLVGLCNAAPESLGTGKDDRPLGVTADRCVRAGPGAGSFVIIPVNLSIGTPPLLAPQGFEIWPRAAWGAQGLSWSRLSVTIPAEGPLKARRLRPPAHRKKAWISMRNRGTLDPSTDLLESCTFPKPFPTSSPSLLNDDHDSLESPSSIPAVTLPSWEPRDPKAKAFSPPTAPPATSTSATASSKCSSPAAPPPLPTSPCRRASRAARGSARRRAACDTACAGRGCVFSWPSPCSPWLRCVRRRSRARGRILVMRRAPRGPSRRTRGSRASCGSSGRPGRSRRTLRSSRSYSVSVVGAWRRSTVADRAHQTDGRAMSTSSTATSRRTWSRTAATWTRCASPSTRSARSTWTGWTRTSATSRTTRSSRTRTRWTPWTATSGSGARRWTRTRCTSRSTTTSSSSTTTPSRASRTASWPTRRRTTWPPTSSTRPSRTGCTSTPTPCGPGCPTPTRPRPSPPTATAASTGGPRRCRATPSPAAPSTSSRPCRPPAPASRWARPAARPSGTTAGCRWRTPPPAWPGRPSPPAPTTTPSAAACGSGPSPRSSTTPSSTTSRRATWPPTGSATPRAYGTYSTAATTSTFWPSGAATWPWWTSAPSTTRARWRSASRGRWNDVSGPVIFPRPKQGLSTDANGMQPPRWTRTRSSYISAISRRRPTWRRPISSTGKLALSRSPLETFGVTDMHGPVATAHTPTKRSARRTTSAWRCRTSSRSRRKTKIARRPRPRGRRRSGSRPRRRRMPKPRPRPRRSTRNRSKRDGEGVVRERVEHGADQVMYID